MHRFSLDQHAEMLALCEVSGRLPKVTTWAIRISRREYWRRAASAGNVPSDMLRDDDLIDDDYQGNAYAPFASTRDGGSKPAASSPGAASWLYGLLGVFAVGAFAAQLLAPTGLSGTLFRCCVGTTIGSMCFVAFEPTRLCGSIVLLLSLYVGAIAIAAYLFGFHG